jgi:methylase of polypeptide subunit release factors
MRQLAVRDTTRRYQSVDAEKAHGATYTPESLARFVAERIIESADLKARASLTILDPAIGDGALVLALLDALKGKTRASIIVHGFDTNVTALDEAARRIRLAHPKTQLELTQASFLDILLESDCNTVAPSLFSRSKPQTFDLIIANPPYVRTQIMGSDRAQQLASTFGLTGRVDLYHAFLLGMARLLAPDGTTGIIVSNRFMTTKGGGALRAALRQRFALRQIWDLGDTKLFSAAVLPAVIVARGSASPSEVTPLFTSIYEVKDSQVPRTPADATPRPGCVPDPLQHLQSAYPPTRRDARTLCR